METDQILITVLGRLRRRILDSIRIVVEPS